MVSRIDDLYLRSPVWLQQVAVASYGVWWFARRFGPQFHALVAELVARERASSETFRAYQAEQLRALLTKAASSTYYRPLVAGLDLRDPHAALARMPLLSKDSLRQRGRDLLTEPPPRGTHVFRSSGTTGTPSEIFYTKRFHALELAMPEARNLRWAGVGYRDRRVMFGARKVCSFDQTNPPFWRVSPVENLAYCSIYHLSPATLPAYVAFLQRYRPVIVMGYPSALVTLARYVLDRRLSLPGASAIMTTSETVTEEGRHLMESAWQTRIWDRYGAVEGCLFASQCEEGRYHVSPDIGLIEILDADGKPCAPGVVGEVVVTGLQNMLQPLVRYRIGDAARWAVEQTCPCGRQMPILEQIEGRFEDMCVTPDGRQILRFDTAFKGVQAIREAQVVQRALDRFELLVVPTPGFGPADVEQLRANMRLHVGDAHVDVTRVAEIPRTAAGKFRAVICELSGDQKRAALQLR
jgi:phenylacetate-CoA ligase